MNFRRLIDNIRVGWHCLWRIFRGCRMYEVWSRCDGVTEYYNCYCECGFNKKTGTDELVRKIKMLDDLK